jgi:nitrogen fixation protein FixH
MASMPRPREITGRFVLFCFLGFFGVVFAVNAVMLRLATSTFGGVETQSSYKAGLAFKNEIAAARAQDALHWSVDATVKRDRTGTALVDIAIRDERGRAPERIAVDARLTHPMDARLDHPLDVTGSASAGFSGRAAAGAGQWTLVVEVTREGERVFRSRNRIVLP